MIQGLNLFADNNNVAAICGHCYPFRQKTTPLSTPYFLKHFACWGWATWKRSWDKVCWDTGVLKQHLKQQKGYRELNFGVGEFVSGILEEHHNGYINTWDVQTGVSFFVNDQYCLYPPETLSNNTGWRANDHSTHSFADINPNAPLAYTDFLIDPNIKVTSSSYMWKTYNKSLYPPHIAIGILIKKGLRIIAPFLRPLKHKIQQGFKKS